VLLRQPDIADVTGRGDPAAIPVAASIRAKQYSARAAFMAEHKQSEMSL